MVVVVILRIVGGRESSTGDSGSNIDSEMMVVMVTVVMVVMVLGVVVVCFAYTYFCALWVCLVPAAARKGQQISWIWS